MDRDQLVFQGKYFADSMEEYYRRERKAERKRKQYKYWMIGIGILGIMYFIIASLKISKHDHSILSDDFKKIVDQIKPHFFKPKNCEDRFVKGYEDDVLRRHEGPKINFEEICKWKGRNMSYNVPEFPIAFVYKATENLITLDTVLNLMYHPKHLYCVIVDKKEISDNAWKAINKIDQCLPNIFVVKKQDNVRGHGLECLSLLLHYNWNYSILLNENDVPIKTISEISDILKLLKHTSDVPIFTIFSKNISIFGKFTYGSMDIFRNKNILLENKHLKDKELTKARTIVSITLSREDVEYYFTELNGESYLKYISKNPIMSRNNVFWPTLLANKELGFPSHVKPRCNSSININIGITNRYCRGFIQSHNFCPHSTGYLGELNTYNEMFVNNFDVENFPTTFLCWAGYLYNRTISPPSKINYVNLTKIVNLLKC
uniref:Glyco_trans_2-like domain-containing protein n=1 Tax=Parastrongyloides trichosuri TaxID=131310 RepID=A0A0N4Z927_PARTI